MNNIITGWEWTEATRPHNYGVEHIIILILTVLISVMVSLLLAKKHDKSIDRKFIFSIGVFLLVSEIYKEVLMSIDVGHYLLRLFPWQFCSVPMWVCLIVPFIRNEKIENALYSFLAFYGFVGGFVTSLIPSGFSEYKFITISYHSLIWHSILIIISVYLFVARNFGRSFKKELLPAFIVFVISIFIAVVINISVYNLYINTPLNVYGNRISCFYMSPYYTNSMPILSTIEKSLKASLGNWFGFIAYFIVYFLGFNLIVSIVFSFIKGIRLLSKNKKKELVDCLND